MRVNDEINALCLLDQVKFLVFLHDTIDLRDLVVAENHEEVGERSDALVLKEGKRERLCAGIVAALADEFSGRVTIRADYVRNPVVDLAQKHPVSNELFERSGQFLSLVLRRSGPGHVDLRAPRRPELRSG
jgi:hypothetical protein